MFKLANKMGKVDRTDQIPQPTEGERCGRGHGKKSKEV